MHDIENQSLIFHCHHEDSPEKNITLKISAKQITTMVKGMMPLFELTVNVDKYLKIKKKESTLDYVAFLDLHCPIRNQIFRFNDRSYQFNKDKKISANSTAKAKWQELERNLCSQIKSLEIFDNFYLFGESATQFPEMLKQIKSGVNLYRREDTVWDQAWQLYSGLIFLEDQNSDLLKT